MWYYWFFFSNDYKLAISTTVETVEHEKTLLVWFECFVQNESMENPIKRSNRMKIYIVFSYRIELVILECRAPKKCQSFQLTKYVVFSRSRMKAQLRLLLLTAISASASKRQIPKSSSANAGCVSRAFAINILLNNLRWITEMAGECY